MRRAFFNGVMYTGNEVLKEMAILVEDETITGLVDASAIPGDYMKEDLHGMNIAPSFIDLQIYGGNGKMFSHELSEASLQATYEYSLSGGASRFMITMATNSPDNFLRGIETVKNYLDKGGKGLLGLHLEGPYLNPVKKGAHIQKYIRRPNLEEVRMLVGKGEGVIKMITIAPEMCDDSIIDYLLQNNIIVSAGHSNASYEQATVAFNRGIPAATHLFNAMSAFQSREPGMVGAIYDHPSVQSSVVCDGVHVDFAAIRISKRIMKERLFFITDAVTESKGEYEHIFKGDRYTLPDGTLSGSSLTMMQSVRNAVLHAGIDLEEALRMASLYPATLSGNINGCGHIQEDHAASFVIFDDELNVIRMI